MLPPMAFGSHHHNLPIGHPHKAAPSAKAAVKQPSVPRDAGVAGHTAVSGKLAHLAADWEKIYSGPLCLTPSQARFARLFWAGHNLLLTGSAGTGKSYLTKALFAFLRDRRVNVGVTATTGIAAFGIGGQTIHSFCGIGLADEPASNLIAKVFKHGKAKARIRAIDVLFIDEVSMAKGDLLNKVNAVFKAIRHSSAPFGGVQVVFTGDWLQLAPVFKGDETQELAFQSAAWQEAAVRTVLLNEQMRQREDSTLLRVLNDLRVGSTASLHLLDDRIGAAFPADGIEAVRVFCRNVDVDRYNAERLAALPGQAKVYRARDTGDARYTDAFNRNCPAPEVLELKVGAQVLLLVNMDVETRGLCNGSVGVIKSFGPDGVHVMFKNGLALVELNDWSIKEQEVALDGKIILKTVATRRQMPLKVCYAITTHRCQGMTLDRAVVDMSDAFGDGMVYCALSRVRDMGSLSIAAPIPRGAVKANRQCIQFYRDLEDQP